MIASPALLASYVSAISAQSPFGQWMMKPSAPKEFCKWPTGPDEASLPSAPQPLLIDFGCSRSRYGLLDDYNAFDLSASEETLIQEMLAPWLNPPRVYPAQLDLAPPYCMATWDRWIDGILSERARP